MQENKSNTTLIISSILAVIVVIGGLAAFASSSTKPEVSKDLMSKSSEVMSKEMMMKKEESMKMEAMKKEEAMKKDTMSKDIMSKTSEVMTKTGDTMTKDGDVMKKDDAMMKKEGDSMSKDAMTKTAAVASPSGKYSQYSVTNLAQNASGTNIIFFHAPWCPACRAIESEINANLNKLPEGFQILKADFDTSTALKQKYGITQQSTFVKVDKDGNKLGTSAQFDLKTVDDIIAFGSK